MSAPAAATECSIRKRSLWTAASPMAVSNNNGGRGWFGTVQAGCDYQAGSSFVIGAFADYDFSGIKGDMAVPVATWVGEEKLKSSWAAGGRVGWLPFPQLLGVRVRRLHAGAVRPGQLLDVGGGVSASGQRRPSQDVPTPAGSWAPATNTALVGCRVCSGKQNTACADYGADGCAAVDPSPAPPRAIHSICTNVSTPSAANWSGGLAGVAPRAAYAADLPRPMPSKAAPPERR